MTRTAWKDSRRGFVLAPILYILGLIGISAGILFSSNMQILRSNNTVQNGLTAKSDLQGTANTLSAQGVFSTDNMTLCPPRSTHQTLGNPCAAAPIGLVQFGDLPALEVAQLPQNYANASSSGSPTEVGVFAAGAGTKMLDPYGHLYIYCRWENPRSNPSAPAFVLLSAGDDGVLQTTCGSSAAQGDDYLYSVSVGEAINRAALWQSTSSNGVTYGATGTQVSIDGSGDLSAVNLSVSNNATIANALSAGSLSAPTASVSGTATIGTGDFSSINVSGNAAITGNVGIGTVVSGHALDVWGYNTTPLHIVTPYASPAAYFSTGNGSAINAIGGGPGAIALYATVASGSTPRSTILIGQPSGLTADLLEVQNSGGGTLTAIHYNGAVSIGTSQPANMLDVFGAAAIGNGYAGSVSAPSNGLIVQGNVGIGSSSPAATLDVNGSIHAASLTATGAVTGASGSFTNLNVTNETITGTFTAGNFSFLGTGSATGGTFTNLTATNASITNSLTVNSATVTNGLTAGSAAITNGLTAGSVSASSLSASSAAISGALTAGSTTLGSLAVTNNETVGGTLSVSGVATLSSANVTGALSVSGDATFYGTVWLVSPSGELGWMGEDSPYPGGAIMYFGTSDWSGYYDYYVGSSPGSSLIAQIGCNPCGGSNTAGGYLQLFGSGTDPNNPPLTVDIESGAASYFNGGSVGIGTASPAATLDVNGYIHLKKNSSAPATCNSSKDGAIALTAVYTLCVCKSGTGWVTASTGSTSCTF